MIKPEDGVDEYLHSGCMRCELGGTPQCKTLLWTKELKTLRKIALGCGLEETVKWGVPCYMHHGKNICIIAAFKEYCVLSFVKGVYLQDEHKLLSMPGENTQSVRVIKFTNAKEIVKLEKVLKEYLFEAMEIENAGLKHKTKAVEDFDFPAELKNKFREMPELKNAFEALTPGRQKGYLYHFSQAKQSTTRSSRIEKCIPKIMQGKGMLD